MKFLVACDSFKGSLKSNEVNELIKDTITQINGNFEVCTFQMSDGGEGFLDTVKMYVKDVEVFACEVYNALGKKRMAHYCMLGKTAYIESAEAIGIEKIPKELLNIKKTSSYGLGEIIENAYKKGATEFIIGLGGSATSDMGLGLLQALDCQLIDTESKILPLWQNNQLYTSRIVVSPLFEQLKKCTFKIISDVEGCLTGRKGAAMMFSEQKGATKEERDLLEESATRISEIFHYSQKYNFEQKRGSAAAGGLGYFFQSMLNAETLFGSQWFMEISNIVDLMKKGDILITGEGSIDQQTLSGKGPGSIALVAKQKQLTTIGIGGKVTDIESKERVFDALFSIQMEPRTLSEALSLTVTKEQLIFTVRQIVSLITILMQEK